MTEFSETRRKIRETFKRLKETRNSINDKQSDDFIVNFFKNQNKVHVPIYDSGWLAKAPDASDLKTIEYGTMLPSSLSVSYTDEIEIPDSFLPFIDVQVLIKPPPNAELATYYPYTYKSYTGNYIEVKGDGSKIYSGVYPIPTITDANLSLVDENKTKKRWRMVLRYTDSGSGDTIEVDALIDRIQYNDNERDCTFESNTTTIVDSYDTAPFGFNVSSAHKITDLSTTSFSAIGDSVIRDFGAECAVEETNNEDVTFSKAFADAVDWTITFFGERYNVTQDATLGTSTFDVVSADLISIISVELEEYIVYYSTLTQKPIAVVNNSDDLTLANLPNTTAGDTLPYTTLTLDRNLGSLADILTVDENTGFFTQSVGGNVIRTEKGFWKMSEENNSNFPFYYMKVVIGATILFPAIIDDPNPDITTQDDSYTQSGTTYSRTTENTGAVSEAYVPDLQDVQYRVMVVVKNPFWYKEVRKYDINQ